MKDFFSFTFPAKPYIAKYLHTLYGNPVIFDVNNYFGTTLLGYLTKKVYKPKETKVTHRSFDVFNTPVNLYLPSYWLRNYKYKTDLTKENIILLNKHIEQKFEEELTRHCYILSLLDINYQDAIEDFCIRHNIELDVDISFEALKKKEYREREVLKSRLAKSDTRKSIQPRFF